MKIGLVGGKEIRKYTIADYLWKEIGKVTEQELSFTVYPVKDNQILEQFWQHFKKDDEFKGFNIASPWKQRILDRINQEEVVNKGARFSGINVIYKNGRRISCENADVLGIEKALALKGGYIDKNILILGAGGVGGPTAFHLASMGARNVYLFDICRKEIFFDKVQILESFHEISKNRYKIIINATPHGKFFLKKTPEYFCAPISLKLFREVVQPDAIAIDLNYLPVFTEFLNFAHLCGLEIITGVELLVRQAAESFYLYTDTIIDDLNLSFLINNLTNYSNQKEYEIIKRSI